MIPTQDKNRPKADFCPSWFIIFGQQKSCAPIRIFTYGVANSKKMVQNPLNHRKLFLATSCTFFMPTKNAIRI